LGEGTRVEARSLVVRTTGQAGWREVQDKWAISLVVAKDKRASSLVGAKDKEERS
jgi:hypothetical protein